ncbi:MAG: glycoside hydrolase family 3 protein [Opitutaceae bacterium]
MTPAPEPSLREKIGQMLLVGCRGAPPAECDLVVRDIRAHHVGGVILFDQDVADPALGRRNIHSPAQVRELLAFLQAQARVPLLTAVDQEGGRVNRLKPDYGFPPSISHEELGRLADERETHRHATTTADTLKAAGFNLNLAPVVDLDANPDNPVIRGKRRSFSADPGVVARHAAAFVRAHRERGILTCEKHFPGHGSARGDTHLGLVDVTTTWAEHELEPFRALIAAGLADMIMTAHVFNARLDPDRPATLSFRVVTRLLRDILRFDGVVVSDDMEMRAISSGYGLEESVPAAVEAGIDLLCFGNNLTYDPDIAPRAAAILERAVTSGRIPLSRIDTSHRRLLALKRRAGLID